MPETKRVAIAWQDGLRFRGGAPDGPAVEIDADNATAPGPMLQLLLAAAGCTGADVVSILEKMRAGLRALRIEVEGVRREEHPRRYTAIHYRFVASGEALDEAKLRRAVELSLQKYCSVSHTLAPDIAVTWDLVLE